MTRIKLDPAGIQHQLQAHRQTLKQGLNTAAKLDIHHLPTPHRVLMHSGSVRLIQFLPTTPQQIRTPVLICYALVNRPWILDLSSQRSMIRNLLDAGVPVYLVDWGYPARCDRYLTLEDYLVDLLDRCVDHVRQDSHSEQINLMGVCQGGVLSLCYSALFPRKIRNLITLVTPVDTSSPRFQLNRLSQYIDAGLTTATYGNLPGALLNELFTALQPGRLGLQKRLAAAQQLDSEHAEHYLLMEQWLQDCPDLAGAALQEFIQLFFRDNALMSAQGFQLAGQTLNLGRVQMPVLNIFGSKDQLVPPESSIALGARIGSNDYTEAPVESGHIGVLNGRTALRTLPSLIQLWLKERDPA
ncbi:polyhydroxyalkanoate synthase [Marinobacterium halophilum]|uniref:Polyhydroxyalkanoate synthase n=1 Tax=Marinobacterium halophilum TaxID=267374 RepID=A0A2P8EZJ3_9GAMM|nr:alpha/beta fold hydrolase [Marinobacterium halophilum]PSL14891.1 polyhydroxyalkanoate synthase [Marinobacterium halophilum]